VFSLTCLNGKFDARPVNYRKKESLRLLIIILQAELKKDQLSLLHLAQR